MTSALVRGWSRIAGAGLLAGVLLAATSSTPAVTASASSDIRVRFGGDLSETRVVIDLDRAATGQLLDARSGGQQIVLLLQHVDANNELAGAGRGLVNGWTVRRDISGVRVQLDLTHAATVRRRFLLPPADGVAGYRYVMDLSSSGEAAQQAADPELAPMRFSGAGRRITSPDADLTPPAERQHERTAVDDSAFSSALRDALNSAPPPAPTRPMNARRVIVIDAGHGGHDPGAQGSHTREKDVTLAAARELQRDLMATGRYRVVMTRNSDTFVSLQDRVRLSRRVNADLFLSLHADAVPDTSRRGASVYTLSDAGGSRVTRVLGRNEWFLRPDTGANDRSVSRILLDLTQRSTRNRSADFAQLVVDHITDRTVVLPRAHRDANYFVLLAPDVPAALLEMGFITNKDDERALNDADHRAELMHGVTDAIDGFFAEETTLALR
jgi:N-acetylmuramoyl-L-alanine amidase